MKTLKHLFLAGQNVPDLVELEGRKAASTLHFEIRKRFTIIMLPGAEVLTPITQHIDQLKKENFNIKLKVHFLEERLAELAPDQIDAALKQNINLKIEVQQHRMDLKKQKKLILELEQELERIQRADSRTRDLEERLAERERELKELRRRKGGDGDDRVRELEMLLEEKERELRRGRSNGVDSDVVQQLEMELDDLKDLMQQKDDELDNVRGLLLDNNEELERMRDTVERTGSNSLDDEGNNRPERLMRKVEELEKERAQFEDEKDDMLDEIQMLRLEIENVQRRRDAESIERSHSRAMMYEEQEGRAAVEDDLNAVRDKNAAAQIELQQKEDDLEMKARELDDVIVEHQRIVELVEDECRAEINEARQQVEDMQDALAEKEAESKELRMEVAQLESQMGELHEKLETALGTLEQESEEKDAEIEAANREIEKLGQQVYMLEEELDRLRDESEQFREDEAVERERLNALTAALREVLHATLQMDSCLLWI
jgi:chromosome segregation ATPase